jgi:hypothetical protein
VFEILSRVRMSLDVVLDLIPDLLAAYGSQPQPTVIVPLKFPISL